MPLNLRALKIYTDGSCPRNPGGAGGYAARVEYPFGSHRPEELIFSYGYFATTNNRMELKACVDAYEWILNDPYVRDYLFVQIVTDSKYVRDGHNLAIIWSQNQWRSKDGRHIRNIDLWKDLIRMRRKLRVRVEVELIEGKSTPIARAVDRDAKLAAKTPSRIDDGYHPPKVGRPKNTDRRVARLFPATGEDLRIRVYSTEYVSREEQKVKFETYSDKADDFVDKHSAYADAAIGNSLHRQNIYRVRMNDSPQYPRILEILPDSIEDRCTTEATAE